MGTRPEACYREVGAFRKILGSPVTLALTATATPAVRDDIRQVLGDASDTMPLFADLSERENLDLQVVEVWDDDDKLRQIEDAATRMPGTGIVYFTLIRDLERMAGAIQEAVPNRRVARYHGRLEAKEKKRVYDLFAASPLRRGSCSSPPMRSEWVWTSGTFASSSTLRCRGASRPTIRR